MLLVFGGTTQAAAAIAIEGGQIAEAPADEAGIQSYRGIPYAAAPVGALRWKAPAPVRPWDGVRGVSQWGAHCMQNPRLGNFDPLNPRMDEDCLYLNVWTPVDAQKSGKRVPVMVWIYGGSNSVGAASQPEYDGEALARKGVVLVSFNYRVDIFGFLAHPELTAESGTHSSGNYGLLDQIAALQWVQRNIDKFGGDPKQVTVFGESAGAFDISLLMASPLTHGLFARAIGESGGAFSLSSAFGPKPLSTGEQQGESFMQAAGAKHMDEMRRLPATELLQTAAKNPILFGFGVVDGYVVPEHPAQLFAKGLQQDVPLLTGQNADEGSLFVPRMKQPGDADEYAAMVKAQFKDQADQVQALYPAGASGGVKSAFTQLMGDQILGYGNWAWAEAAAKYGKSPVYRYYFNRRPPAAPAFSLYPLAAPGAYHFAEILYVFNHLDLRPEWQWQEADRHLSDTMAAYWTNFAKTGNPNAGDLPRWEAYQPGSQGKVMGLGAESGMVSDPAFAQMRFWDSMLHSSSGGQ